MKEGRNNGPAANTKPNGGQNPCVRFEYHNPNAQLVFVAGTFNDWRPGATQMIQVGRGQWLKEVILPAGVYEYRFVVDNEWIPDPLAEETVLNPFGDENSVLRVSPLPDTTSKGVSP